MSVCLELSDYNTKYKCDFMPSGGKVFKDHHGVWLDFLFFRKKYFSEQLQPSIFFLRWYSSLLSFVDAASFRIHIRCIVCLPIECIAYHEKKNTLNSEKKSTNVKELKLNCTLVFHSFIYSIRSVACSQLLRFLACGKLFLS